MAGKRHLYTCEFKLAILAQVEAGKSLAQVARENGLHPTLVARWKREYRKKPEETFRGSGHLWVLVRGLWTIPYFREVGHVSEVGLQDAPVNNEGRGLEG